MLRLKIDVNGELLHTVQIINRGEPPDPVADDERVYGVLRWDHHNTQEVNQTTFAHVRHLRLDGALVLAKKALEALISEISEEVK